MALKSFESIINHLLPGIIESGWPDPELCRQACPQDAGLLSAIVDSAEPKGDVEERALGHITGIAADLMGARSEALVVRRPLNYVGYQMNAPRGMICVQGEAGNFLGAFMTAGTVLCQGSCGDFAFRGAQGGTGLVMGEAGDYCAEEIGAKALVRVMGSVGCSAGRRMSGGELRVEGDAGEFFCRYMEGGRARARRVELLGETYGGTVMAEEVCALEKGQAGCHRASLVLESHV